MSLLTHGAGEVAQIGATALHPTHGETQSEVILAGRVLQLSTGAAPSSRLASHQLLLLRDLSTLVWRWHALSVPSQHITLRIYKLGAQNVREKRCIGL